MLQTVKGKSVYYLTDLHSSQSAKGLQRYDKLSRTSQITFCSYTVFPNRSEYVNSFSLRHDTTGELLCDAIQQRLLKNLTFIYIILTKIGRFSCMPFKRLRLAQAVSPTGYLVLPVSHSHSTSSQ